MSEQVSLILPNRNPDVLSCIANLSNDEVFTPPDFANRMLNTLADAWAASHGGANIWSDKSVRFLDPCTKSGVFLREIASRLTEGLKGEIPDLHDRVDHIVTKQVFGIGTTQLTSLMARRSVYCSKWANGKHSIAKSFATDAGNIWFERLDHTWVGVTEFVETADENGRPARKGINGRCKYCGASQRGLDRGEGFESHAYAFIHTDDTKTAIRKWFGGDMEFDVIIGNPPYQLNDGGGMGTSATPIYHLFVERALDLDPRYALFVTPSRWFAGGKGLDKYRERMLRDRRIRTLVDYPKLYDGFPGVKIRGGVSYFLWDRDYDGPCTVQTMWDSAPVGASVARYLDAYDVLVRWNAAVPILEKVRAKGEPTLNARISSRKPFGFGSNVHGESSKDGLRDPVLFYGTLRTSWIERSAIKVNADWVDSWKVLITKAQGTSAAVERQFVGRPIVAAPGSACSETYLVAGVFREEIEAECFASYLRTRFVRFFVSLRKSTQNAPREVYAFVPDLPPDRARTDAELFDMYGLWESEIDFIESQVTEMTDLPSGEAEDAEDDE